MSPEEFFNLLPSPQRRIASELRRIVKETIPMAVEMVKFGMSVYQVNGWVCAISAGDSHVDLSFFRGVELDYEADFMEGRGNVMRHIPVKELEEIQESEFKKIILEAMRLDSA